MADTRRTLRKAGSWLNLSIVGIQFPVAIVIGFLWGRWLDRAFGTWPYLTGLFSLFGIAAGFLNLFRITAKAAEEEERERDSEGDRGADPPAQPPAAG
jgi:ATP synthase protein I